MNKYQKLSNGSTEFKSVVDWKKKFMRKIWHTVTPENVFATARRVNRIGAGAKLKPTEEVILKSL